MSAVSIRSNPCCGSRNPRKPAKKKAAKKTTRKVNKTAVAKAVRMVEASKACGECAKLTGLAKAREMAKKARQALALESVVGYSMPSPLRMDENPRRKRSRQKAAFEAAAKKAHDAWMKRYMAIKEGKVSSLGPLFKTNPRKPSKRKKTPKWSITLPGKRTVHVHGTKEKAVKMARTLACKFHKVCLSGPH